jgi:hypothetical protein
MTDGFAVIILAIVCLVFGIVLGYGIGERLSIDCITTKDYWKKNAEVLIVGTLASAVVWATGLVVLAAVTIGAIAGAIVGLKFGFGESSGPWKAFDKTFRVNRDQVATAESGKGEERRRRRKEGGPEPELMSTITDAPQDAAPDDSDGAQASGGKPKGSRRRSRG